MKSLDERVKRVEEKAAENKRTRQINAKGEKKLSIQIKKTDRQTSKLVPELNKTKHTQKRKWEIMCIYVMCNCKSKRQRRKLARRQIPFFKKKRGLEN